MPRSRVDAIGRTLLWLMVFIVALSVALAALAHEAPTGWKYDNECCHSQDCAPAEVFEREGKMWARNKHGEAPFPTEQSRYRASGDKDYHACFFYTKDQIRCLYAPSGS